MATYREMAASGCEDGTCPTFYVDDQTGDVLIQGYATTDRPPGQLPAVEDVVRIDAKAWARLTAQLPR